MRIVKILFLLLATTTGNAFLQPTACQVTITGPTCVLPQLGYQYLIKGTWVGNATLQVCVTGGVLVDSASRCRNGSPVSFIRVVWDSTATSGLISVSSSSGSASQSVTITKPLKAGSLAQSSVYQHIGYKTLPSGLQCSAATGGNCSPAYRYQWQQSDDAVNWSDTVGVSGLQFGFSAPLTKTKYYRLKVTETGSGTMDYSGVATLQVDDPATTVKNN